MSRAEETRESREHSQESDQASVASVQPLGVSSEGPVGLADTPAQEVLRARVREACAAFGNAYWRELDRQRAYPEEFVRAFTQNRLLAALIPDEYGGLGLPLSDAAIVTEEINHAGGNAGTAHAQMYIMGALLRHGTPAQKRRWLPPIASGGLRLQAFGVTEAAAGSDTTQIRTEAVRHGDVYVVNGEKRWTSRLQNSDLMLLLARTSASPPGDKTRGLSLFLVDLREANGAVRAEPIRVMMNNQTNAVTIRDLVVPAENRIGEEGRGFRYLLDGLNTERILIAAECIGDGRWFIEHACDYSKERVVFDRPIGQNQGVQFPIARAHIAVESADLMRRQASARFDASLSCGAETNMAKLLASEASWQAANACLDTFGGNGFAADYDVERKFRETRLYTVAPVANNLILCYVAEHVLGLPRSY